MTDKENIDTFVSLLPTIVKKNVKVVTPDSLGQDFLLHIDSPPVPKVFIPRMPSSADITENPHVPRITVSDTLIGCMLGYTRIEGDFFSQHNGWIISKFDFNYALSVNKKMVFDAEYSNEHWLVTYNKNTIEYKPIPIGKFFIYKISYVANEQEPNGDEFIDIYLELHGDDTVKINKDISLTAGFYIMSIRRRIVDVRKYLRDYTDIKIKKINQQKYIEVKSIAVSMLDNNSINIPLFTKW